VVKTEVFIQFNKVIVKNKKTEALARDVYNFPPMLRAIVLQKIFPFTGLLAVYSCSSSVVRMLKFSHINR
jgi:hypothetical protein